VARGQVDHASRLQVRTSSIARRPPVPFAPQEEESVRCEGGRLLRFLHGPLRISRSSLGEEVAELAKGQKSP
jgi:hypothetical protein